MNSMTKIKYAVACFWEHAKAEAKRWTGPRTYTVAYSVMDKNGNYIMDSMMVKGVVPDMHAVVAAVQQQLSHYDVKDLRILSFTEAPACVYKGSVIDSSNKLVEKVDKIADDLKQQASIKPDKAPSEPAEDEDEEEDLSDMFK